MFEASKRGIAASAFREPDLDNSLTAIAIAPSGAKIVRNLKLALSGPGPKSNHVTLERAVRHPRDEVVLAEVETVPQTMHGSLPPP